MIVRKFVSGAGCGKTATLLQCMEDELAAGVAPGQLAFLTFTVAARHEAKTRAMAKFGFSAGQLPWIRTLHSTAYELLGVNPGTMVTLHDGLAEFGDRFGYAFSSGDRFTDEGLPTFGFQKDDKLLAFDHFRRQRLLTVREAFRRWTEDGITLHEVERFTQAYAQWKREDGRVDFTDLLERGGEALPCEVVIVDEAQDLSPLQWRAFWQFAAAAERVYIAGDDLQAVYEWAGADAQTFLEQPGEVTLLPQSWRCPAAVTTLANQIAERIAVKQTKTLVPRPEAAGRVRTVAAIEHVEVPEEGSVLFLYRNHRYAKTVTHFLQQTGLLYEHHGKPSVDPESVRAILGWERLRKRTVPIPRSDMEAILAWSTHASIGQQDRDLLRGAQGDALTGEAALALGAFSEPLLAKCAWYRVLDRLQEQEFYLRTLIQSGGAPALVAPPRIRLSTIHGAKGAEADHVVLLTAMTGLVKRGLERDPDAERRVWYVGVTRAKETLTLVGLDNRVLYG